jgi:serine/threonine protein kinase
LNHPYICQLHDIGPDYLVLEYVEGKSLPCPLPEREAVRLGIQIATALEAAHKKGIIHRDLKPLNIMVTDEGSVKLLDFGLAKLYEQDVSLSVLPTADLPATQAGTVLGTVAYMSPEQAQGQPADARSDIFSFGLVLYEMLSGKRAFSGESPLATAAALIRDELPPFQAKIPGLKIIARTSSFAFRGKEQDITKIAEALRVRTILEGSVRRSGSRIRVTAQLITAADGSHVWSERYDRQMTDVFDIQDEICQAIVDKLRVELKAGSPPARRQTENVEAHNLYMKGRYYLYKATPEHFAKSKECLEQAVALDPNYATA